MTTHLTRSGNTQRLRLQSIPEAHKAGNLEAVGLLVAISNLEEGDNPAELMSDSMGEIIALAVENRVEECGARLGGFCEVIGHALARACDETGPRFNYSLGSPNTVNITDSEGGEL
jgi:hypothetical protein